MVKGQVDQSSFLFLKIKSAYLRAYNLYDTNHTPLEAM